MRQKCLVLLASLGMVCGSTVVWAAPVTVKGEVMDLACYSDHGAKGAKHAECAAKCLKSGMPAGILSSTDNVLYVAIWKDHKDASKELAPYAGKNVEASGEVKEQNGVKFLVITSVKAE